MKKARTPAPGAVAHKAGRPSPRALIEEWLPAAALGFEAQRERAASSALPPLYFLHVWWARRPLVVSRAAVLAALLPAWSRGWPPPLRRAFPSRRAYQAWFLELVGLGGAETGLGNAGVDPAAAGPAVAALDGPRRLRRPRAFTHNPSPRDRALLGELFLQAWGTARPRVLDPMAGGGSIPFEALRCGLAPLVNELNPVAWVVLRAGLACPARFGSGLADDVRAWGQLWADRVRQRLERFYPPPPGGAAFAYLWARTVPCPDTGRPVPLSPNWWLRRGRPPAAGGAGCRGAVPVAARLLCGPGWPRCRLDIVHGAEACAAARPEQGTVRLGAGVSPWTGRPIAQAWIKSQAQAGRLGQQLYAVAVKTPAGLDFVPATPDDEQAAADAAAELARQLPGWRARGLVPDEPYPPDSSDLRPRLYGMPAWCDLFSPRQLLAQCTMLETLGELAREMGATRPPGAPGPREEAGDRARAVLTLLALALDKACDYNSRLTRWDSTRTKITNTFARHDFSLKWSHAEFDAARSLLPWALDQVTEAYSGAARLLSGAGAPAPAVITLGDAASLPHIPAASLHLVCLDPPYYDNVQYAECSDFFYVWLKRALGGVYPEAFRGLLTDKDREAVANPARFGRGGEAPRAAARGRQYLAAESYRRRLTACLLEARRVLQPHGLLTLMFTHKQVEAWAALASALIEAGFQVEAAWPVRTESQHSTHQAGKSAATSTVLLACRRRAAAALGGRPGRTGEAGGGRNKRDAEAQAWEETLAHLERLARREARRALAAGAQGPDLYIAAFGPALAVLSQGPEQAGETAAGTPATRRVTAALAAAQRAAREAAGPPMGRPGKERTENCRRPG